MKRVHIILFMLFASFIMASAQDFAVTNDDGVTIYYGIIYDDTTPYACVTYNKESKYSGTVVIPEEVTYNDIIYPVVAIGYSAFGACPDLTTVIIPNSVSIIGPAAFNGCTAMNSITIPESVTYIGRNAFYDTGMYNNEAYWDNNVMYIDNCLVETKYEELTGHCTIKEGTRLICETGFFYCWDMTCITIPNTVKHICESAFHYCTGLTYVEIPESVTAIESATFWACENLLSVKIPNSVTEIKDNAFAGGCSALTFIEIPQSVTFIGQAAFSNCTGLRSVTVANEDPANITMHHEPFFGVPTDLCTLYVPKGSKELYAAAEYWREFTTIVEVDSPGALDTILQDNGKATYYDLKGIKIEKPTEGNIYIQVKNGLTTKVVYRE